MKTTHKKNSENQSSYEVYFDKMKQMNKGKQIPVNR